MLSSEVRFRAETVLMTASIKVTVACILDPGLVMGWLRTGRLADAHHDDELAVGTRR